MKHIRSFQRKVSLRLLMWSMFSMGAGYLLSKRQGFWRGVGLQFVSWGAIDGLIAVGGQLGNMLRRNADPAQETRNLRRILWINAMLDIFYVLGGRSWMQRKPKDDFQRGNGFGVIIQGAFLLLFDLYHALKIDSIEDAKD